MVALGGYHTYTPLYNRCWYVELKTTTRRSEEQHFILETSIIVPGFQQRSKFCSIIVVSD